MKTSLKPKIKKNTLCAKRDMRSVQCKEKYFKIWPQCTKYLPLFGCLLVYTVVHRIVEVCTGDCFFLRCLVPFTHRSYKFKIDMKVSIVHEIYTYFHINFKLIRSLHLPDIYTQVNR